jgi:hypothetical protein
MPLIQEAEELKIALYFVDAAHFVLGANLGYLWSFFSLFYLDFSRTKKI